MSEPSGDDEADEVAFAGLQARIQALIADARGARLADHTISAASEAAKTLLDVAPDSLSMEEQEFAGAVALVQDLPTARVDASQDVDVLAR